MGIPKFFRWAGDRYRAIVSGIIGEQEDVPPIDNFYLDMNGVIHNCSHSNDAGIQVARPTSEILGAICEWLQYMVEVVVKPKKLIYFAVDGVAPRAKLNQQRARRFRAAADRKIQLEQARVHGAAISNSFDSNCITPGTEFMVEIGNGLRAFIAQKMMEDPSWVGLEVIFSGCEVPGEGEHKIISYIRDQKEHSRFPPNLRHCIYGADADMILLALATHEPYTVIIREILEIDKSRNKGGYNPPVPAEEHGKPRRKKLQFIRINVLRESLINEFSEQHEEGTYDGERVLDDFVFLTFLIGNDFLPHLPGIDIGDSAFDIIFDAYKTIFASEPGYLVEKGKIDYKRLETLVQLIGTSESIIFQENEVARAAREARQMYRSRFQESNMREFHGNEHAAANVESRDDHGHGHRHGHGRDQRSDYGSHGAHAASAPRVTGERNATTTLALDYVPTAAELAHYSADDHRRLYYVNKFHFPMIKKDPHAAEGMIQERLRPIIKHYLEGLSWCLAYYTQGCSSWSWYYPYHYGVFLQDMKNLEEIGRSIELELSTPLQPFQQLLACLPPMSSVLLPPIYREIMTSATSPMHAMYPTEFATDLNGKKNDYEAVVLLPFIDANQLLETEKAFVTDRMQSSNKTLSEEDRSRNDFGVSYHYKMLTHEREDAEPHLSLHIEELPMNIHPGHCFEPILTPGTSPTLDGFPDMYTVQTSMAYGHTVYFHRGGVDHGNRRNGGGRGGRSGRVFGRGGGEGSHGDDNNHSNGRSRGGRQHSNRAPSQQLSNKPSKFGGENPGEAFPMPGFTMVPSLSTYQEVGSASKSAQNSTNAIISDVDESEIALSSPLVINFVLDDNADQFLSALTLQIQQQVSQFNAYVNLPMGRLSYTTVAADAGETEYAKISLDLSSHPWDAEVDATAKVRQIIQKLSDIFGPLILQIVPLAFALPKRRNGGGYPIAVRFQDHSHLGQIEQYLDDRMRSGTNNLDGIAALPANIHVAFPREIVLGEYMGSDVGPFADWLSSELAKFAAHFPSFYCHIVEAYGRSGISGDSIDLQLSLSGESNGNP